jgi:sugar/nucleoside kinase (ribokinase family)
VLGVLGDVVQDVVVWQLEPQRKATDTRSQIVMRRGGSAANVAAFAATRHPTRFIGCVGADLGGHVVRQELESHGVDVRLQVDPSAPTGMIVLLVDEHGERTMFPSRGANAHLTPIDPVWLEDLEVLHLTGYSFETAPAAEAALQAVTAHHARGGLVSFDVSSTGLIRHYGRDAFLDLMSRCRPDFISANRDECALLDLAHAGRPGATLARFPDATVLARRGKDATTILRHGELLATVPVTPVHDVRDLTGAGDAFNAGFLTAHLNGEDLVRACRHGHTLAARVLRSPGATEGTACG